jgi:hypothetical protein
LHATEDHHLVPLGTAATIRESSHQIRKASSEGLGRVLNSPLNRTLISTKANRKIGSKTIQQYLDDVTDAARVARHLPAKEELVGAGLAADAASKVMKHRFDGLLDDVLMELDGLAG